MRFTAIDGGHMHVAKSGGIGRPVLFLNSLGTDLRIWDGVIDAMPGLPHLRYDKRGHGLSAMGDDPTQMAGHVADVVALLESNDMAGAVLCGVSVGGLIALGVAGARPDLVGGLVLCNTAARIGTPEAWSDRIAAIEADGVEAIADTIMERWFSPEYRAGRPTDVAGWRCMLTRCPSQGYLGVCAAIRDTDFSGFARALSVPVRVVGGTADGATPPDVVTALADMIPGAALSMIEGCGHLPCIEAPARLAAILGGLRDELDGMAA